MNGARDLHSRIWRTHAPAPRNNAYELGVLTDGAYPKAIDCLPPAAQIARLKELAALGVAVKDGKAGATWEFRR